MPLQKQPVAINFSKGLDTKTDPWQIPVGNFYNLVNSVFTKGGLLTKREGFANLPSPTNTTTYLSVLSGNLLAIGQNVQAYSFPNTAWEASSPRPDTALSTISLAKNSYNEFFSDSVVSSSGLVGVLQAFFLDDTAAPHPPETQYSVLDATTGQTLLNPVNLVCENTNTTPLMTAPRIFDLGNFFIICYLRVGGGFIDYITINKTTLAVLVTPVQIAVAGNATISMLDGTVFGGTLYLAYGSPTIGVSLVTISSTLVIGTPTVLDAGRVPVILSVTGDASNSNVWVSYVAEADLTVYSTAVTTPGLVQIVTPTQTISTPVNPTVLDFEETSGLTSLATGGTLTVYAGIETVYPSNPTVATWYIEKNTITNAGVVGIQSVMARSICVASKAFFIGTTQYLLGLYPSHDQGTLFLMNGSGQVISRLAYTTAESTAPHLNVPSATVLGLTSVYISYLVADYSQSVEGIITSNFGINQVKYSFSNIPDDSLELSQNLMLSGGFLWNYDALTANENNFFLFPEFVHAVQSNSTGTLTPQQYQYQVIYSWVDNKGNLVRSGPSIPISITLTAPNNTIVVSVPTVRLSYKTRIGIEVYRWSVAQPIFYRITPTFFRNDPTVDEVFIADLQPDASILGNELIYTTGNVIPNDGAPSTQIMTIWDDRLWMVNAEDPNQLWFGKQSIEDVPVEMSDLLTYFVAPTVGSQGATGPVTALAPLDDKLVLFKENAIEYINGSGPDNTGANNNYSQPIFVTSTSGCITHKSIAVTPAGILYQSDKGIWQLGRDLQTRYIGAPVENYTQYNVNTLTQPMVVSTLVIPRTTQVRFMLNTGITLMYDYFYEQWGSFTNITAQSSILYHDLHTFVNLSGVISQQTPNLYADAVSTPVLMSFQTGWINVAGLQGYERSYYFYLLGQYFSTHTLNVQVGYDYKTTIEQVSNITPVQVAPPPVSTSNVEQWRVFLTQQKCQAFQLTISEQSSTAGEGLTLSGLNMVIGKKKGYPVRRQNLSVG